MLMQNQCRKNFVRLAVINDIERQWRVADCVLHAIGFQRLQTMYLFREKIELILHDIRRILIPEPFSILTDQLSILSAPFQFRKNICSQGTFADCSTPVKIQDFRIISSPRFDFLL